MRATRLLWETQLAALKWTLERDLQLTKEGTVEQGIVDRDAVKAIIKELESSKTPRRVELDIGSFRVL